MKKRKQLSGKDKQLLETLLTNLAAKWMQCKLMPQVKYHQKAALRYTYLHMNEVLDDFDINR